MLSTYYDFLSVNQYNRNEYVYVLSDVYLLMLWDCHLPSDAMRAGAQDEPIAEVAKKVDANSGDWNALVSYLSL